MSEKDKKSLDKKHKKSIKKYEANLKEYLDSLDESKRCKYDEVITCFDSNVFCEIVE